jgi:hypothetical protein
MSEFLKKIKNLNGTYKLNLADPEECAYYLESFGGETNLKDNYPLIYRSFVKAQQADQKKKNQPMIAPLKVSRFSNADSRLAPNNTELKKPIVDFNSLDFHCTHSSEINQSQQNSANEYHIYANLNGDYMDPNSNLDDASQQPQAYTVFIKGRLSNPDRGNEEFLSFERMFVNTNQSVSSLVSEISFPAKKFKDIRAQLKLTASVFDTSKNKLDSYTFQMTKNFDTTATPFADIVIEHPVSKTNKNHINVLYGRGIWHMDAGEKIDYQYPNNNKDTGTLHTILPIKGYVKLKAKKNDSFAKFDKLTQPSNNERLMRSSLDYDSTDWLTYEEDLEDDALYKKLTVKDGKPTSNFIVTESEAKDGQDILYFDFYNNSFESDKDYQRRYDWGIDISSDVTGVDNRSRICYLTGQLQYDLDRTINGLKLDTTGYSILIKSVDQDKLKHIMPSREYYKFHDQSNTIYIPPIKIWWGCHARDTKIQLADGSTKRADEITVGQALICNGKTLIVNNIYTGHELNIYQVTAANGASLQVSVGHPLLLADDTGIAAENLKPGDQIRLADHSLTEVMAIEKQPYDDLVYNFTFAGEEAANYLVANGFLSGDFYAQNSLSVKKIEPPAEHLALVAELERLLSAQ